MLEQCPALNHHWWGIFSGGQDWTLKSQSCSRQRTSVALYLKPYTGLPWKKEGIYVVEHGKGGCWLGLQEKEKADCSLPFSPLLGFILCGSIFHRSVSKLLYLCSCFFVFVFPGWIEGPNVAVVFVLLDSFLPLFLCVIREFWCEKPSKVKCLKRLRNGWRIKVEVNRVDQSAF